MHGRPTERSSDPIDGTEARGERRKCDLESVTLLSLSLFFFFFSFFLFFFFSCFRFSLLFFSFFLKGERRGEGGASLVSNEIFDERQFPVEFIF